MQIIHSFCKITGDTMLHKLSLAELTPILSQGDITGALCHIDYYCGGGVRPG